MEEVYKVANEYYSKLESFKGTKPYKNKYFWLTIISTPLFLYFFGHFFSMYINGEIKGLLNEAFAKVVVSEVVMLFALIKLGNWKSSLNLEQINKELGTTLENRNQARHRLLESYFSCTREEFLDVALRLQKMLDIACIYSDKRTSIDRIYDFIYNNEARARILTLLVLFCSIIALLAMRSGQNLNSVITFFSEPTGSELLYILLGVLTMTLAAGLSIGFFFKESKNLLIGISLNFSSKSSRNIEAVKYLITDLNEYHQFQIKEEKLIILPSAH